MSSMFCSLCVQLKEEAEWKEKLEVERARTMNLVQPKTNYKEKYEHLIGKEAALDAARYQLYTVLWIQIRIRSIFSTVVTRALWIRTQSKVCEKCKDELFLL